MKANQALGETILMLRAKNGYTIPELSKRSGVNVATISDIERGKKKNIHAKTLYKLASALSVEISELLHLKEG